jgi:hypothetical protein
MKTKSTSSSTKDQSIPVWSGTNYSYPKFDRAIMSWARVKWNGELGRALWENTFPDELFDILLQCSKVPLIAKEFSSWIFCVYFCASSIICDVGPGI